MSRKIALMTAAIMMAHVPMHIRTWNVSEMSRFMHPTGYPTGGRNTGKAAERREAKRRRRARK